MSRKVFGLICGAAAVGLFLIPTGTSPLPPISKNDEVSKAFDTYEQLWRKLASEAAAKLDSGELKTDAETREFIASGQEPARKIAFKEIAESEQKQLGDGKWTPALHSSILKGYSK